MPFFAPQALFFNISFVLFIKIRYIFVSVWGSLRARVEGVDLFAREEVRERRPPPLPSGHVRS